MKFEFYVLNYNFRTHMVEMFNIFDNCLVQQATEKAIRKYVRCHKSYSCGHLVGFAALCEEIRKIILWQEWGRREYEISVGDAFETDCNKLEKWDCYRQVLPNIRVLTRELVYQYKKQLKEAKDNG